MSFIDDITGTVKNIDTRPIERYANKQYARAAHALGDNEAALSGATAAAGTYLTRTKGEPDYLRGFVAGLIGGMVGTGIKALVEQTLPTGQPAEEHGARLEVVEAGEDAANTDLDYQQEEGAQKALDIAVGALAGGVYGMMCEALPATQTPVGIPFGAALWTINHKILLPALGLTPTADKEPLDLQAGQLGTHIVYGTTVETVRRAVRHVMDDEDLL